MDSQWIEDMNGTKLPQRVWITEFTTVSSQLSKLTVLVNGSLSENYSLGLELVNSSRQNTIRIGN